MDDRFLSRGKCKDNGEWVVGYCVCTKSGRCFIKARDNPRSFTACDIFDIIPETLGGCTSLTDKNGKLIFEGDIVTYGDTDNRYYGNYAVAFEQRGGCAYFGIKINDNETWQFCLEVHPENMEVIGNIHDNPELLESEVE